MNYTSVILSTSLIALLTACGGGSENATPVRSSQFQSATAASGYRPLVQQLYVSYFGRPADSGGFENFQRELAAIGGTTSIQALVQAYNVDTRVRALVDSFGSSAESTALYGGDNTAFVTAIYQNVLGRAPDSEGLKFWVGAVNRGELSRARASLDIMAGALANSTNQGVLDAALVNKKITVALNFTDGLLAAPVNGYSGDAAAAQARALLNSVTALTDVTAFQTRISSLINTLANPTSIALRSAPDPFFGGTGNSIAWPYSSTGSASASYNCIGNGCTANYDIASFQLVAAGKCYTITNLQAINLSSGSKIQPSFSGLTNGQVIEPGKTVSFKLQSPLTGGTTVIVKYDFTILETGDVFSYTLQLRTN